TISDAFIALDKQWRFSYLNQRAEEYLGKSKHQLLGQSLWQLFPSFRGTELDVASRRALESGTVQRYEHYDQSSDRWFEHQLLPNAHGLIILSMEITHVKHTDLEFWRVYAKLADRIAVCEVLVHT